MGELVMTTIGITGANGFFGWHLRCHLVTIGIDYICADRQTFASDETLDRFVGSADVIVHLAGVNRAHEPEQIRSGNIELAVKLATAATRTDAKIDIVYANSVKADEPGPYGESKAQAAAIFKAYADSVGSRFIDIKFPHLFGEFGRPHYNSAVTTFASQLANGEPSMVGDGMLELLHAQEACELLVSACKAHTPTMRPSGREISVPDVYATMVRLADYASSGTVPLLADDFELGLFNTIRSQMWPDHYPFALTSHADDRGSFFEVARAWGQGQTSISTTVPGVTRGEHYHLKKIERFAVISGEAQIRVRRLFTNELCEFNVSGADPCFVDMPPLCTHDITNTGTSELVTLFWSHDHFDPQNADTWPMKVAGEALAA